MFRAAYRILLLVFSGAGLLSGTAWADLVYLTNGGVLEGRVREEKGKVIIERPDGFIAIPIERVARIERRPSLLDLYEARLAKLDPQAPGGAPGFVELARWCAAQGMNNHARKCCERALQLDPECEAARIALGFTRFGGVWLTEDELQRARGFVRHGNAWVTPEAKGDLARLEAQRKLEEARAETARQEAERAAAQAERAQAEADANHGQDGRATSCTGFQPVSDAAHAQREASPYSSPYPYYRPYPSYGAYPYYGFGGFVVSTPPDRRDGRGEHGRRDDRDSRWSPTVNPPGVFRFRPGSGPPFPFPDSWLGR